MTVTAKASIPFYDRADHGAASVGEVEFTDESLNAPLIGVKLGHTQVVYVKASDLLSCVKWITGHVR